MNVATIFAGGVGRRMNSEALPKQFLKLYGKPIIVYTIENFERHELIDGIVISCLVDWIPYMNDLVEEFGLTKVVDIVPGGKNGQESIYYALRSVENNFNTNPVVLIHDGVRPLIDKHVITKNIESVNEFGSAITSTPPEETFLKINIENKVVEVQERKLSRLAKAPQSFFLNDILAYHRKAIEISLLNTIDSCTLMYKLGQEVHLIDGNKDNIKITTPTDYFIFKGIIDSKNEKEIFG